MTNGLKLFLYLFEIVSCVYGNMEGFVIGGGLTNITRFPHAAYLSGQCGEIIWMCGSTVLNQQILLTAAHCLDECTINNKNRNYYMLALLGHEDLRRVKIKRKVVAILLHKAYNEITVENDIGLLVVKRKFPLGNNVKRVILSPTLPRFAYEGFVAGWGATRDEDSPMVLKHVYQKLRSLRTCSKIGSLHKGMFCASDPDESYPASGDSGSALVTTQFYEIGLVSFKVDSLPLLTIYTNITYYYDWINTEAKKLYCSYLRS